MTNEEYDRLIGALAAHGAKRSTIEWVASNRETYVSEEDRSGP